MSTVNKLQIVVEVDAKTGRATIRQLGEELENAGRKGEQGFGRASAGAAGLRSQMGELRGLAVSLGLTFGAMEISRAVVSGSIAVQRMDLALLSATGSAGQAATELAFVRSEADRLGLELLATGQGFVTIAAAAKGTELAGAGVRDIFSGIAEASASLSLSAPQTNGALLAIGQMISKGKVNAEELRLQLGERLPGAFQIAARAMGVTTQELDKMLEKGEILATDFLPRFAAELHKTFGPNLETAVGRSEASFNRLKNSITDMEVAIGNSGLINFLAKTAELSSKSIQGLTFLSKAPGTELNGIKLFGDDRARLKEFMNADLLTRQKMVAFEQHRRTSETASVAIISGENRGTVLDDGALGLEFRAKNPVDDKAVAASARKNAKEIAQAARHAERLAEQWSRTREELEKDLRLTGLQGLDLELAKIGEEAAKLRAIPLVDQGLIADWQAEAENAAIQADYRERQKKQIEEIGKAQEKWDKAAMSGLSEQGQAIAKVYAEFDGYRQDLVESAAALNKSMEEVYATLDNLDRAEAEAVKLVKDRHSDLTEFQKQAYRNMESAAGDFFRSLRSDSDDWLDNFIEMCCRMVDEWAAAQAMMGLFGQDYGKGGELGGLLGAATTAIGSYIGGDGGITSSAAPGTSYAASYDAMVGGSGDFDFASLLAGGRANGGPVSSGKIYEVNERNIPELLNTGGKQYLMMGSQGGHVTPVEGGAKGPVSGSGNSSAPISIPITIIAADAQSFTDMVRRNPEAVMGPFREALKKGDRGLRVDLQRVLS